MNLSDAAAHFGSKKALAKACGISEQAVQKWRKTGIPDARQFQIEQLTDGALKALPSWERDEASAA